MAERTPIAALPKRVPDESFSAVIRTYRAKAGMNQTELAEKLGVSRNTVAGWETGHARPDLSLIPALCRALRISTERFFGTERRADAEERRFLGLFNTLEESDREAFLWQMEAVAEKREAAFREKTLDAFIRIYESDLGAAAGFGAALDEARGETVWVAKNSMTENADQIITVSGRSMEPTYYDGDRVLVQTTDRLREGDIGVFLVNNEGFIKEYRNDGLHSHNPGYRTMRFSDSDSVRCVGKVLGRLEKDDAPDERQLRVLEDAAPGGKGK